MRFSGSSGAVIELSSNPRFLEPLGQAFQLTALSILPSFDLLIASLTTLSTLSIATMIWRRQYGHQAGGYTSQHFVYHRGVWTISHNSSLSRSARSQLGLTLWNAMTSE